MRPADSNNEWAWRSEVEFNCKIEEKDETTSCPPTDTIMLLYFGP